MLTRRHGKEPSMGTEDSSILETLAEVHIDVRSEGTSTNKASQEGDKPISLQDCMRITNQSKAQVMPSVEVNEKYQDLFQAVVKGDWKAAEKILDKKGGVMVDNVMTVGNKPVDVLEFVVMAGQDQYQLALKLFEHSPPEYKESILRSVLYDAARRGRTTMVKELVKKAHFASNIVSNALSYVTLNAPMQKEVIWHLARQTTSAPDFNTMSCLIQAGHLDIALFLASKYSREVTSKDNKNRSLLGDLAKMKSYFASGDRFNFWEKCIYECIPLWLVETSFDISETQKTAQAPFIKKIGESKLKPKYSFAFVNQALIMKKKYMKTSEILEFLLTSGIVLDSALHGPYEIVELCLQHFPELMWDNNFVKELMKKVVNGRQAELFRLVNAYNRFPYLTNDERTRCDLMEAVVEWSSRCVPANVSGAAFLIQRELQWFKVVESGGDPSLRSQKFKVLKEKDKSDPSFKSLKLEEIKGGGGKTYWEVFVEQRQGLLKEARQWMKDTSSSCSLVATLIVTVAFAAAFTVPGGNDNNTGIPIFLDKDSFIVFAVANALALFSSVTATLMFLAILTSHYAIEDFLHSLPRKMILGLGFLVLSLGSMLVAFSSALTFILSERLKWMYIPITLLAALLVILFAILQLPMCVDMAVSTYQPPLYRPM